MEPILKTENLRYVYGADTPFEKVAVDNINLEIFEDEFIGVIGRTGSGKSTLIQHFNGILRPTSGTVFYNGSDCWAKAFSRNALRFNVGLVFQYPEYQLFEETVEKDIAFGPSNMGLPADEIEKRISDSLRFVGLDDSVRKSSPFELSGGQKRRIAIAGIMAMNPRVLILDEPTAGLDPRGRDEILQRISEYRSEKKSTVIIVSHNMEDISRVCSKVLVMRKGQVEMFAPVNEVFEHSEELCSMGLNVPQITRVFISLKEKGFDVPSSVYTPAQACDAVIKAIGGDGT
ncbi:MAG: energy-coupling factor transporter ATPase [Clostridia bacterium]|nr:energy-coupling factor transporter ATPase [Clostridia bacterium]